MKKRLSNSDVKELAAQLGSFDKKDIVETDEAQDKELLLVNGSQDYFKFEGKWVPTLRRIYAGPQIVITKSITVDMGAVRFVTNGADVMRPGIKLFDDGIEKDEIVLVKEITHGKVLALGKALFSGEEMKAMEKGKVIQNLHYIGDWLWNLKA